MNRARPTSRLLSLSAALLFAAVIAAGCEQETSAQQAGQSFAPLVKGTDPAQFQLVEITSDGMTISDDGEIALAGRPNGYFATKQTYENYVLRFEWKYDRPADLEADAGFDGNSGCLLHIREPHRVWPACVEAQLMNRDAGFVFGIAGGKFTSRRGEEERRKAHDAAIKPVGEWNAMEITSQDGAIKCLLNGTLIDEGDGAEPASGPIGWQSEGRPIRFRKLEIRKL
jgi:hypothetical protein